VVFQKKFASWEGKAPVICAGPLVFSSNAGEDDFSPKKHLEYRVFSSSYQRITCPMQSLGIAIGQTGFQGLYFSFKYKVAPLES
jgi:hypothetical protein